MNCNTTHYRANSSSVPGDPTQHTSRIIRPLLLWLFPDISEARLAQAHVLVRKSAHVTEYAIMGWLLLRALRHPRLRVVVPCRWTHAVAAVGCSALVASGDEFFQTFWIARQGSPWDVLLDTFGATLGVGLVWLTGRLLKRW